MIDIKFEIDGRPVDPRNIVGEFERMTSNAVADNLRTTLASVRDPETGEFPSVLVRGNSLDNMSIQVEGSDAVVALAIEQLNENNDQSDSPDAAK